jgi:hypothetical protein
MFGDICQQNLALPNSFALNSAGSGLTFKEPPPGKDLDEDRLRRFSFAHRVARSFKASQILIDELIGGLFGRVGLIVFRVLDRR